MSLVKFQLRSEQFWIFMITNGSILDQFFLSVLIYFISIQDKSFVKFLTDFFNQFLIDFESTLDQFKKKIWIQYWWIVWPTVVR